MSLSALDLHYAVGRVPILRGVSLEARPGEFLGIIGPNGAGKSTLMALLSGIRTPTSGRVAVGGEAIDRLGRRETARRLALVEQQAGTEERITAREVVELGRTPHLGPFTPWSDRDDAIVRHALRDVGMLDLAERSWHGLSGGERQRLHIARALAQQPDVLLLDEPTNHLDIGHQISLLDLVRRRRKTVVAALHDLNHAAMFCDRLIILNQGIVRAEGEPREVLTSEALSEVFGVEAHVVWDGDGGCHIRYRRPASLPVHVAASA